LTSHNEASPVSILEALACSVPVVATRVGSVSETVLDGWNGYTVAPGDAKAIADHLASILTHRELAESLGKNGREHVCCHGSLDSMVRSYESLIHSIFLKKSGRF
jgi:glycosyltransferase involved in cell wall biosynthesis